MIVTNSLYDHSGKEAHIFMIVDGKLVEINPPTSGFGECTITWKKGKITEHNVLEKKRHGLGEIK